jgi:hypothetical protein
MARQANDYEWRVVADEAWADLPPGEQLRPPRRTNVDQWFVGQLLRWSALALVMILTTAGITSQHVALPADPTGDAVRTTLAMEKLAWQTNDTALQSSLVDPRVGASVQREWRQPWEIDPTQRSDLDERLLTVAPLHDYMLATMVVNRPDEAWWRSTPYREIRFYRETPNGWVRTTPASTFWGSARSIETPTLRFEFHDRDAPTVIALLDRLELANQRLDQLLAITSTGVISKATFVVAPDVVHGWGTYQNRMRLTSPFLAKVPNGLNDEDYLAQMMVNRLTHLALTRLLENTDSNGSYRWRSLLWAVSGWLRTTVLEQRTPWHLQAETAFRANLTHHLPLRMTDVVSRNGGTATSRSEYMEEYMIAESVVAYAVDTYGVEKLPALVRSLTQHGSWAVIAPQVFDVSMVEFEAGWNRYVVKHYSRIDRLDQ